MVCLGLTDAELLPHGCYGEWVPRPVVQLPVTP
jgi:hypothetical protein